jgi:hypothetical protein
VAGLVQHRAGFGTKPADFSFHPRLWAFIMEAEPLMHPQPSRWIDVSSENITLVRATRLWVQYGIFGFAVFCIIVGAVESLFGR